MLIECPKCYRFIRIDKSGKFYRHNTSMYRQAVRTKCPASNTFPVDWANFGIQAKIGTMPLDRVALRTIGVIRGRLHGSEQPGQKVEVKSMTEHGEWLECTIDKIEGNICFLSR